MQVAAIALIWLAFFPNAPYLVTDFLHWERDTSVIWWYELALIVLFAWTGCVLAAVSLRMMHGWVRDWAGRAAGAMFVLGVIGLSGVGVYLGRFHRFNSWDLVTRPGTLWGQVADGLADPLHHGRAFLVSLLFALVMLVCYVSMGVIGEKE